MGSRKPVRSATPEVCPVCGDAVPRNALACPECGADARSGWREGTGMNDEGGDDFDYDEFVKEEFGSRVKPKGLSTFWWLVAIAVIVALGVLYAQRGGL